MTTVCKHCIFVLWQSLPPPHQHTHKKEMKKKEGKKGRRRKKEKEKAWKEERIKEKIKNKGTKQNHKTPQQNRPYFSWGKANGSMKERTNEREKKKRKRQNNITKHHHKIDPTFPGAGPTAARPWRQGTQCWGWRGYPQPSASRIWAAGSTGTESATPSSSKRLQI